MSYIELGHSLIIRSKAYDDKHECHETQGLPKYADLLIVTQEMTKYHLVDQVSKLWASCRNIRNDCLKPKSAIPNIVSRTHL